MILQDHILVGKIWDVKAGRFITKEQLLSQLLKSDYLLLGEIHDNLIHHKHQAWVIDALSKHQRNASVAFEMIDDRQAALIDKHKPTTASELIEQLEKVKNSWHYERNYKIIFEQVFRAGYQLKPANMNRKRLMQAATHGQASLPGKIQHLLQQTPLTNAQTKDLQEEIVKGHCDMIGIESTEPMVLIQRIRDAVMSQSLLESTAEVRVLITGAGHARNDRGVPLYLRRQDDSASIVTIAFTEVAEGADTVPPYKRRWDGKSLPFDYLWFSPRVDRIDPCIGLRKHLHKKTE